MLGVIYKITCLGTGRSYIGKTINYESRVKNHFRDLSNGVHVSRIMQSDYNEYGYGSFTSEVLCSGAYDYLGNLESFCIGFYAPEYNSANVNKRLVIGGGIKDSFDIGWDRLYGKSVPEVVVKPIKEENVKKVASGNVGRPNVELSAEVVAAGEAMLEMGVSVSVMCRKLGIYRVKWYRHKKAL